MFYCKYYINSSKWDINFKSAKCQKQKINEIKRTANKIKKNFIQNYCALLCYALLLRMRINEKLEEFKDILEIKML